ncbi:MAG: protein kinase [Bryobacterales bacterium]|nr:protein kinase [Bryobacterales bacterium]
MAILPDPNSPESPNVSRGPADTQWQKIEELFAAAVELPDAERRAFVDRETAGNPGLRAQLEELLAHAGDAPSRIAQTIEAVAQSAAPDTWAGQRFGPYRLIREIGRGGMGMVFEAERDDAEYRKRVALKIGRNWQDTEFLRQQFLRERQILAELEHPIIARLLDGGTEQGLPYFAMEFVEGMPINRYCTENSIPLRQKIAIFRQVCAAIDYAHSHLIVHRDLKPNNILVGADGTPKVLDFGIAKLLDSSGDGSLTTGAMLWTPDYASPEQVRGHSVTTRSDVYSLGLILYELLCGEKAQIADTSSPLALDKSICEVEPEAPSARVKARSERSAAAQLEGDLDMITTKAIRKDPHQRYESVAALSEDLRRYLEAEPIRARPSTGLYRFGRFVKRNRLSLTAAVLVTASILGGAGVAIAQARLAERRFDQVRKLATTFLFDFHDKIKDLQGSTEARQFVLSTATTYLDSLSRDAGNDTQLLMELTAGYQRLASVQGDPGVASLGRSKEALADYTKATELAERVLRREPSNPAALRALVETLANRSEIELLVTGNYEAGLESLRKGTAYSARLLASGGSDPKVLMADHRFKERLADSIAQQKPKEAIPHYESALASAEAVFAHSKEPKDRLLLATTYLRLSRAHRTLGNSARTAAMLDKGLLEVEQLQKAKPDHAPASQILTTLLMDLGAIHGMPSQFHLNQPRKAIEYLKRAETIIEKSVARDPKNSTAQQTRIILWIRMAEVMRALDAAESIRYGRNALAGIDQLIAGSAPNFRLERIRQNAVIALAQSYRDGGQPANVLATYDRPLPKGEDLLAKNASDLGGIEGLLQDRLTLGQAYTGLKDLEKAEASLHEVGKLVRTLRERMPEDLFFLRDEAEYFEALGDLALARGDRAGAADQYRKASESWKQWVKLAVAGPYTNMHHARLEGKLGKL